MTTYYKVLAKTGRAHHGGVGKWHLPTGSEPGKWMPEIDNPEPCVRGYHACRREDLIRWLGPEIYVVELRGDIIQDTQKVVAPEARLLHRLDAWNETTARLFAVDCATRALNREKRAGSTPDSRSYEALKVARRFAKGQATQDELAAAQAAAQAAARDAARAAETKWQTKRLFEYLDGKRS